MLLLTKRKNCCRAEPKGSARRLGSFVSWVLPAAVLVLVPKCPLCIVAYVAIVTGIGLSVSTAESLRILLFAACVGPLAYLVARFIYTIVTHGFRLSRFR